MFPIVNWVAKGIATALGAGYSPIAPGTCGTLVTLPLAWALSGVALWVYLLVVVGVTAVGIWAAGRADQAWGTEDSGRIVIDEVAGYLVTMTLVARDHWVPLVVGFVVFRVLEIAKPPPIRWRDQSPPGGSGVAMDGVPAGVMGLGIMVALDRFGALAFLAGL